MSAIERSVESLRRIVGTFELILVDDCSTDATAELARELDLRYPEIRLVRNDVQLRQGGSLLVGFDLARYDYVMHNAADLPFDFDDLPLLLDQLPAADVVVASRRSYPGTSAPRRFVSLVNRGLIRLLFRVPIHDYNFVQLYAREVLREQPAVSDATSFVTAEKIIRAYRAGRRVVEVDVEYRRREVGVPSSANWRNIRRALADMVRLRLDT